MQPQPHDALDGCTYYMTLIKDTMQVRVTSCVYLLQDLSVDNKITEHYSATDHCADKLDIFLIEQLWKNER